MIDFLPSLADKKILILGFGREGQSTFNFLRRHFPDKQLAVADQLSWEQIDGSAKQRLSTDQHCSLYFGPAYLDHLSEFDLIIKTPGIPSTSPPIRDYVASGKEVTSQTALFFSLLRDRIIGVTGTKGKSTTTNLIYHILKTAGKDVVLLGNIGTPAFEYLESDRSDRWYVFELSSHQLADLSQSPHIAVWLNIFREHLDYYSNFSEYAAAKQRITAFQNSDDVLIYNMDQKEIVDLIASTKAKKIGFANQNNQQLEKIIAVTDIPLLGRMNWNNVMAAICVAENFGIPSEIIAEAIRTFTPLPYRLEKIGTFRDIIFYDDALATIPEATIAAIESIPEPINTLIAGGFDRGQDFHMLAQAIIDHQIHHLILFPPTGKRMWQEIEEISHNSSHLPKHIFVKTMAEAVSSVYQLTKPGTVCLLSAASPSFGIFKDYKDRSDQYRREIKKQSV